VPDPAPVPTLAHGLDKILLRCASAGHRTTAVLSSLAKRVPSRAVLPTASDIVAACTTCGTPNRSSSTMTRTYKRSANRPWSTCRRCRRSFGHRRTRYDAVSCQCSICHRLTLARLCQHGGSAPHQTLWGLAQSLKRRFIGSTSSLTVALCQIYFLISRYRPVNTSLLSGAFLNEVRCVVCDRRMHRAPG